MINKNRMKFLIISILLFSDICSAALMTGAKTLQIQSDKSTFFNCSVIGYVKGSSEIISLESKKLSKYELKDRNEENGFKGVFFDLFGSAGFSTYIESGELYIVSTVDDTGEVEALAFKEAPAFLELPFFVEALVDEKEKKFKKFSIDCGKAV